MKAKPSDDRAALSSIEAEHDPLEPLITEVIVLREGGSQDALEEVCRAHPGSAAELRARLGKLERLRAAFEELKSASRVHQAPRRIGRYTIQRELGRGGMGVVYLAHDEQLGRHIALKAMTSPVLAGERGRKRFAREGQAVAALQHPGIIPLYEAGEDQGVPYFTMQYVEGHTLAHALDELRSQKVEPAQLSGKHLEKATSGERAVSDVEAPAAASPGSESSKPGSGSHSSVDWSRGYLELVSRIVLDIAEALDYAHQHGIVHRDVKPSNILMRPGGRAMLFDFGLARFDASASVTRSGDFVGTPHYVSPEQVLGGEPGLDARTDVYSAGVTLYELLTLRVPFSGARAQEILGKIATKEPTPVRRLNPAVPRDLETICHTAMAKDRERRYASAADMADDLRRFLQFRPVAARPFGTFSRVMRWSRRNPATTLAVGLALVLVVGGPLLFGAYSQVARRRLQREQAATEVQRDLAAARAAEAERALRAAELQRERADRNVARVLSTIDGMLTRVAQDDLVHLPRMDLVRREFLERALALYQELLAEEGDDPELLQDTARAQLRVGRILNSLGRSDEAALAAQRAISLQRSLLDLSHDSPENLEELAAGLTLAALSEGLDGGAERPEQLLDQALELRLRVSELLPDDEQARGQLADTYVNLGNVHLARGLLHDAEGEYRRALRFWSELVERAPQDPQRRLSRAEVLLNLSVALSSSGRLEQAEQVGREALDVWQALLDEHPGWYTASLGWLKASTDLADLLVDLDRTDEAQSLAGQAVELATSQLDEHPDVPEYAEVLAVARSLSAKVLIATGDDEEAIAVAQQVLASLDELAARFPTVASFRSRRVGVLDRLSTAYGNLGRTQDKLEAYELALAIRRELVEAAPSNMAQRSRLGGTLNNLAEMVAAAGDPERAGVLLTEAIEQQRMAFASQPENRQYRTFLRNHLWGLAETSLSAGKPARAAAAARQMPALDSGGGEECRRAAGFIARCAALTRGEQATAWEVEALELLRTALTRGASDLEDLQQAGDLDALRSLEGFAALLEVASAAH